MRRVIAWNMVTLDGFFEGRNRDIGWFVFEEELEGYIKATQRSADILLFGRTTYELMAAYWPSAEGDIARFMNSVQKVVFSRTLEKADWNNAALVRENAAGEVANLKGQDGGDVFVFGSADFLSTLVRHDLVDEFRFGINPVILGSGTPLFKPGSPRLDLRLIEARPLKSGVVILHYEPVRQQGDPNAA